MRVADARSFIWQYYEIFFKRYYEFKTPQSQPVIFDCGSNIGMSILHFKQQYPQAQIHAFEPDPQIAAILTQNIQNADLQNIVIHEAAAWTEDTELTFAGEGADGGQISQSHHGIQVKACDLKAKMMQHERIDFMKIDIEGAETEVLPHISSELHRVENLFVEFHSYNDQVQNLQQVLNAIPADTHRIYMENVNFKLKPFINQKGKYGMDLQLNIFAYKQ